MYYKDDVPLIGVLPLFAIVFMATGSGTKKRMDMVVLKTRMAKMNGITRIRMSFPVTFLASTCLSISSGAGWSVHKTNKTGMTNYQ